MVKICYERLPCLSKEDDSTFSVGIDTWHRGKRAAMEID